MDHDLGGLLNRGIEFTAPEIMCISKQVNLIIWHFPSPELTACTFLLQLLDGMHYIHAQKVLHRDMKVKRLIRLYAASRHRQPVVCSRLPIF